MKMMKNTSSCLEVKDSFFNASSFTEIDSFTELSWKIEFVIKFMD